MTSFDADCDVHGSRRVNCDVNSTNGSPGSGKESTSFRRFPVEIRNMIYSNIIATEGPTTNLIAALRPDFLLYNEILEVLFREHTFVFSEQNHKTIASLPEDIRKRVTKVDLNMKGKGIPTKDVSVYFPNDTELLDISMEFEGSRVDIDHFYNVAKLWFKYFGNVTRFKVVWTNTGPWALSSTYFELNSDRARYREVKPPKSLLDCIKVANKWLGTEGILVKGKIRVHRPGISKGSEGKVASKPETVEIPGNSIESLRLHYRNLPLPGSPAFRGQASKTSIETNRARHPEQQEPVFSAGNVAKEPQGEISEVGISTWSWTAEKGNVLIWNP